MVKLPGKFRLASKLFCQGTDPGGITVLCQLHDALKDCSSVLDIGCGPSSMLKYFNFEQSVGLDGYAPSVELAKKNHTHQQVIHANLKDIEKLFNAQEFDACIAMDVIEHLPKEEGYWLIEQMKRLAKKRIVIFTPNGFLPQHNQQEGELQEHLSGWDAIEMKALGFNVIGMLGPKTLRGEYHQVRYKPRWLFAGLSLVAQLAWTRNHPKSAAAIFCMRNSN